MNANIVYNKHVSSTLCTFSGENSCLRWSKQMKKKKNTNILTIATPVKINLHKITKTETKTAFKVKQNKPDDHN